MKEFVTKAVVNNLDKVMQFVSTELEAAGCLPKIQMQIELAIEEIFVNVANYAYYPETGSVTVCMDLQPDGSAVSITFIDQGVPYNPLAKKDPNVSVPTEQRQIGGLGIFLVKKVMDDVQYEYTNGSNVFTIMKRLLP